MSEGPVEISALRRGASELGVELDDGSAQRLLSYLDSLYRWNRKTRLTAVARSDALRLHLLDSLTALPLLPLGARLADLGSGAGLPGLVLALARPDLDVSLVESRRRRCSFLSEVVRESGVDNCRVLNRRAESLVEEGRVFDCVISRAFKTPVEFVRLAASLVHAGRGRVLVMSGPAPGLAEEVCARVAGVEFEECRDVVLPDGGERRMVWSFSRRRFT